MRSRHALLLGSALASLHCAPDLAAEQRAILGGNQTQVGDFPTVIAMLFQGSPQCTGTLIRPDLVLTAAHCVDSLSFGLSPEDFAAQVTVRVDSVLAQSGGFTVRALATVADPDFSLDDLSSDDIGLIFLEEPVTDRLPSPIDLDPARVLVGETITAVGYGINNVNNGNSGRQFVLEEPIVGCDNPGSVVNGSEAKLLCYDQRDGTGKCNGDSGGPSFLDGHVVGAVSFGDPGCEGFAADTRVSGNLDFLIDTLGSLDDFCLEDGLCNATCGASGTAVDADCADQAGANLSFTGGCATTPHQGAGASLLAGLLGLLWARRARRKE